MSFQGQRRSSVKYSPVTVGGANVHDVRLVHHRHCLAVVLLGVLKGVLAHAGGRLACNQLDALHDAGRHLIGKREEMR